MIAKNYWTRSKPVYAPPCVLMLKSVLKEKLKVMIDISTKLGKEFDRSTLEEAFDRRELINAVDR